MRRVREDKGAMESWRENGVLAIPQGRPRQFGGGSLRTQIHPAVRQDEEQFRNPPLNGSIGHQIRRRSLLFDLKYIRTLMHVKTTQHPFTHCLTLPSTTPTICSEP